MNRYVSEIFGYPPTNKGGVASKIRKECKCPFCEIFKNGECDPVNKKSNLTDVNGKPLLNHQSGACSVLHTHRGSKNPTPVIICPYRFFEKNKDDKYIIFDYIKQKFFKGNNLVLVSEIGLGDYGRADGILCQITRNSDNKLTIHDYAHLELQSDATTGTRALVECVRDFFKGVDITKKDYAYGLNSKASIKGSSLQMIDKGYLFKHFKRKSIWIIQDSLFDVLCTIYGIQMTDITNKEPDKKENLIFVVIKSKYDKYTDKYKIKVGKCCSTSPNLMQSAMSNKAPMPNEETDILNKVRKKISREKFYQL
ncbi:MAG: hypothetical protein WC974_03130 [Thermoplasmata archaeon]